MHEFSIAQQIVETVSAANDKAGGKHVSEIRLRIGELSFIAEGQLLFAITELSKGTKLEKAKVKIKMEPGKVKCPACGFSGKLKFDDLRNSNVGLALCPKCSSPTEITGGSGCFVDNISVELPEEK